MISRGSLSGVIDWGIAGIADPHRDFMAIWDSIAFNFGKTWIRRFFEAYGVVKPDQDRIRFYNLLDRFFAHYYPR
jgi:aminoglycoside 3'-phosphotransferase-2